MPLDRKALLEYAGLIRATWRMYAVTTIGAGVLADYELARDSAENVRKALRSIRDVGEHPAILEGLRVDVRDVLKLCKLIDIDEGLAYVSVRGRIIREALDIPMAIELAFPLDVHPDLTVVTRNAAEVLVEMRKA